MKLEVTTQIRAGVGSGYGKAGGSLLQDYTNRRVSDSGSEGDFIALTVPGKTLNANGDWLEVEAYGAVGATTNSHKIRLYFAGTLYHEIDITTASSTWWIRAVIVRDAANSVRFSVVSYDKTNGFKQNIGTATPTLTSDQTLKFSALGASGASSYSDEYAFLCDFKPAA